MPSQLSFSLIDASGEMTTVTIPTRTVSAVNYDEVFGNAPTQGRNELQASIAGVTLGGMRQISGKSLDVDVGEAQPANVWAQREIGLRVYARGVDTGKLYTITIGTADLDALAPGADDVVPLGGAAMAALVADLEDFWEPTYDGGLGTTENVIVEKAIVVGRRN